MIESGSSAFQQARLVCAQGRSVFGISESDGWEASWRAHFLGVFGPSFSYNLIDTTVNTSHVCLVWYKGMGKAPNGFSNTADMMAEYEVKSLPE